jgi:hypothetical protein
MQNADPGTETVMYLYPAAPTEAKPDERTLAVGPALRRGKLVIALTTLLGLGLGFGYIALSVPRYTAEMLVSPTSLSAAQESAATLVSASSLLSRNVPITDVAYQSFLAMLTSYEVAEVMARQPDVLETFFPGQLDAEHQTAKSPTGFTAISRAWIRSMLHRPPVTSPGPEALRRRITADLNLDRLTETRMYKITFQFPDPVFAQSFLGAIAMEANDILRERERRRAQLRVDYVRKRLDEVQVEDYRMMLLSLLSQAEKELLATQSDLPFAADVVEAPSVSSIPTSPKLVPILGVGGIAGLMLGLGLAFGLEHRRNGKERRLAAA